MINLKKIKMLRLEQDITQEQMAELIKVSQSTYSKYENGAVAISYNKIQAIAAVLKTDLAELLLPSNQ